MGKVFRWSGILGFVVVIVLIASLLLITLPWGIKNSIEWVGGKMAGAEVSLDNVDISISPLGIELINLQVTDAREPMKNLVSFDQALAQLDLAPLFVGKGIIRDLNVSNLQFDSDRTSPGEVYPDDNDKNEESVTTEEIVEAAKEKLPSVDEILARETLKTAAAAERLKENYESNQQAIESVSGNLPTKESLSTYEAKLKEITEGDIDSLAEFQRRKALLDELREEIRQDRDAIKSAKETVSTGLSTLKDDLTTLKSAPGEDVRYLSEKYQLNAGGAVNATTLIFGDQAGDWARQARYWYEKISPYLASDENSSETGKSESNEIEPPSRAEGRFVHFPTTDPWPDFLIRQAYLSGPLDGGNLVISVKDVTDTPTVLGRPAKLNISGEQLTTIGDLNGDIVINRVSSPGVDTANVTISDWALQPIDLKMGDASLNDARMALSVTAKVLDNQLDSNLTANLSNSRFTGSADSGFEKELINALSGISDFKITASAVGDVLTPKIKLGSDLDKQLASAFKQRLKSKQQEFEAELREKLTAEVNDAAGKYSEELNSLIAMDGSLGDRLGKADDLLKQQLADFKDQKKAEVKSKAKEELSNKLKSFF